MKIKKYKPKYPFKEFLWRWGFYKKCPWCGAELWDVGYPQDFCWQRQKCSSSKCEFGKED